MKSITFVEGLVDFGAVETVVTGVGRVEIVGQSMIRIAFHDEHMRPDGEIERPIKNYISWPIERWRQAQPLFAEIVAWVNAQLEEDAVRPVSSRRRGSH